MSMGNAKIEKVIDKNGNERTSRIPQKPLNKFMKSQLLTVLKRDDITIETKADAGSREYRILDKDGKLLFLYDNVWDYGYYYISVPNPEAGKGPIIVAEMDWFENDSYTNPQQQDIFDIFHAIGDREIELRKIAEARKNLTESEMLALKSLGQYTK